MPDSSLPEVAGARGSAGAPALPFVPLAKALGDPLRWAILRELAAGESLMVVEIAGRIGRPAPLISKHLRVLRLAGLVTIKQRLHSVPRRLIPEPGRRELDLGHCLLRLERPAD